MHGQSPIISWETLELSGVAQRFARPKVVLEGIGIRIAYCKSSEWKSEAVSRPQSRDTGLEFPTFSARNRVNKGPRRNFSAPCPADDLFLFPIFDVGTQYISFSFPSLVTLVFRSLYVL